MVVVPVMGASHEGEDIDIDPGDSNSDSEVLTEVTVDVLDNGDAVWTIVHKVPDNDDMSLKDFDEFEYDIDGNEEKLLSDFQNNMEGKISDANSQIDRDMNVEKFEINTEVDAGWQYDEAIEYTFYWTNFAKESDIGYEVSDSLMYSGILDGSDQFRLTTDEENEVQVINPEPNMERDSEVSWQSSEKIEENEFQAHIIILGEDGEGKDGINATEHIVFMVVLFSTSVLTSLGAYIVLSQKFAPK